jgi:hemoglobin
MGRVTGLPDIRTRDDIERLARAFYGKALVDPIIGWLFVDVAKLDLEAHLPRITSFWERILLGTGTYGGGAFRPHAALHAKAGLREGHFERWLTLWHGTVDELFAGPGADLAKSHATRVAHAFLARLEGREVDAEPPPPAGGLRVTVHNALPPNSED